MAEGCLAFGQGYEMVGPGAIVDRENFDPTQLKSITVPFNTTVRLIEQPQLTFRGHKLQVIIDQHSVGTILHSVKVGIVDCLLAPVPLSMFDRSISQALLRLEIPTCSITQRIALRIENMGARKSVFVCWLEGEYIPGFRE